MNIKRGIFRQMVQFHDDNAAIFTPSVFAVWVVMPDGSWADTTTSATKGVEGTGIVALALDMTDAEVWPVGHYQVWWNGTVPTNKNVATFTDFVLSEYSLDDIAAKTNAIGAGTFTATSPVTTGGNVEIVQGDDYADDDGRALSFTGTGWPSLTGHTVEVIVGGTAYEATVTAAGAFYLELTAAETTEMDQGVSTFAGVVTIDSRHLTFLVGMWETTSVPEENPSA